MTNQKDASNIARQTLKRLLSRKLDPTPTNYCVVYEEIANETGKRHTFFPERELRDLIFFLPKEMNDLSRHLIAGASFLSNILLWHEADYFDVASEYKPLLHLWSLGVEEQFYILWPILIFFAVKYNKLFLIILLIFLMSFIFSIITINFYDSVSAFYLPHNRFWELLFGSCLAYFQIYKTDCNNQNYNYKF